MTAIEVFIPAAVEKTWRAPRIFPEEGLADDFSARPS